jgi:methylenetetrahydrofolate dehydrogenase (NADP+)/methenyltetrahydrofolate cyclohydrolase
MSAVIVDGKAIANNLLNHIQQQVQTLTTTGNRSPKLAVMLVGDDPASQVYVSHKIKACSRVGIQSETVRLPVTTSQAEVLSIIKKLNDDSSIDGILPQLPLPKHIDRVRVIESIDPKKDVDGLSFYNQGLLNWNLPGLRPCTPFGIMKLIESTGQSIAGKRACVIGRSVLVGLPIQLMLCHAGATVTTVHSKSLHPEKIAKESDILIAAAGVKHLVTGDWVKDDSIVIDVGIHTHHDHKLTGDVLFSEAAQKAAFITPVPGGVGPMTIASLMHNCLQAYRSNLSKQ